VEHSFYPSSHFSLLLARGNSLILPTRQLYASKKATHVRASAASHVTRLSFLLFDVGRAPIILSLHHINISVLLRFLIGAALALLRCRSVGILFSSRFGGLRSSVEANTSTIWQSDFAVNECEASVLDDLLEALLTVQVIRNSFDV
jgi:hypothetical protein